MSAPVPPQIADLIARLETAKGRNFDDDEAIEQLKLLAADAREHLEAVAKPRYRRDKGSGRELPSYAFGPQNAEKARQALSALPELQNALERGNFDRALSYAKKIQSCFYAALEPVGGSSDRDSPHT